MPMNTPSFPRPAARRGLCSLLGPVLAALLLAACAVGVSGSPAPAPPAAPPPAASPGSAPSPLPEALRKPISFRVHRLCGADAQGLPGAEAAPDGCVRLLLGRGQIDREAVARLRDTLRAQQPARSLRGQAASLAALHLDSPGGDLRGGLELGREIRWLGLATRTGGDLWVQTEGPRERVAAATRCQSSCAYAFLGGLRRDVLDDRAYGVHQFRPATPASGGVDPVAQAQAAVSVLNLYLDEMGAQRRLLDIANLTPNQRMTLLSRAQLRQLGVDTGGERLSLPLPQTPWASGRSERGRPFVQSRVRVDPRCHVSMVFSRDVGGRPVLALTLEYASRPGDPPRAGDFPTALREALRLQVADSGEALELETIAPAAAWQRRERPGVSLSYATAFLLAPDALQRLEALARQDAVLELIDGLPESASDWRFTARFTLDGLERSLPALEAGSAPASAPASR